MLHNHVACFCTRAASIQTVLGEGRKCPSQAAQGTATTNPDQCTPQPSHARGAPPTTKLFQEAATTACSAIVAAQECPQASSKSACQPSVDPIPAIYNERAPNPRQKLHRHSHPRLECAVAKPAYIHVVAQTGASHHPRRGMRCTLTRPTTKGTPSAATQPAPTTAAAARDPFHKCCLQHETGASDEV
ncbi:hypothetical protein COO60DRAFT_681639 [Scenedesmus sp. NREL 46B-D3]|nr:hypothetical protein COO60DRAFT_681639 [Scenedesmus sp. NREL 46B-D3]